MATTKREAIEQELLLSPGEVEQVERALADDATEYMDDEEF